MAITKIKVVTVVAAREGDSSHVDVELRVDGGGNMENVVGQSPGAVKESVLSLEAPIYIENFSLDLFDLYVSTLSDSTARLLLDSIYVFDISSDEVNPLLLGIARWPHNLWLRAAPLHIPGGYAVGAVNLGKIAKL